MDHYYLLLFAILPFVYIIYKKQRDSNGNQAQDNELANEASLSGNQHRESAQQDVDVSVNDVM
ncbi:hypothetical protein GBN23_09860, partial [Plesiomonas shigelloides]|uniref:hypothetical protein n=1 Tax=Plesiomonas shigelloides TaxID=703 RepID=UPI001261DC2E